MAIKIVTVPDLGGAQSVDVIELNVAPGDTVELEDSLIVLESDKATVRGPMSRECFYTRGPGESRDKVRRREKS